MKKIDPTEYDALLPYATPRQAEVIDALKEHGTQQATADALGIKVRVIERMISSARVTAARQGVSPEHDAAGTAPSGYNLKGKSTYYRIKPNGTREQRGQWVKTQVDKEKQYELMLEAITSLTEEVVPVASRDPIEVLGLLDLLAVYPVGDYHLGMLSWAKETGADWDMKIAEDMMNRAFEHLMSKTDSAHTCLIPFLGDFFHYDSMVPETPTSKNQLDSDTRPQKMIRAGLRVANMAIERALDKHVDVNIICEIGNHDLLNSVWLAETLRMLYVNEPRVNVDTSPAHFHYFRFGKCLLATHHGHGTKMAQLPLIMAADRPQDWGETTHRYWYTGHVHHQKTQHAVSAEDFVGCTAESFRVLAPEDAYAANKGYRSIRDMKALTIHKEFGETQRITFNPQMMEK